MNLGNFIKQPQDELDYDVYCGDWLTPGDNIGTVVVDSIAPVGLTVDSIFINDPSVKFWLSGGISGVSYKITALATTADGRVKEFEFKIKVKDE